ncbi:MAG TPA: flagellar biosynthetic protein FliO, partial [Burkholderiaceae bacterium]|nr:flagellar biosynthetic protein FliO [Burkholderiaceae bacterium]
IVRADRKWLVVGVTSQSISLLAELDEPPAELPGGAWPGGSATAGTEATAGGGVRRFADLLRGESRRGPG